MATCSTRAAKAAIGVMIKLATDKPEAKELWRGTKKNGLYPITMTPFVEGGYMYGVDQTGQLRCVKMDDRRAALGIGEPFDDKPKNAGTAFIVKNGDRFFLFTEKGDLIIAKLSPKGYEEVSRAKLLEPTSGLRPDVVWSHPAFADGCVFAGMIRRLFACR